MWACDPPNGPLTSRILLLVVVINFGTLRCKMTHSIKWTMHRYTFLTTEMQLHPFVKVSLLCYVTGMWLISDTLILGTPPWRAAITAKQNTLFCRWFPLLHYCRYCNWKTPQWLWRLSSKVSPPWSRYLLQSNCMAGFSNTVLESKEWHKFHVSL